MDRFRKSATARISGLGDILSLAFAKWITSNRPSTIWHTCATCYYSAKKGPMFCSKYQCVPPVAVIVGDTKCEGYADQEEIPF